MESVNLSSKEEQAHTLERVFEIFASKQRDWAVEHSHGTPDDDEEKDDDVSP